jgi:hypothetical protein
LRQLLTRAIKRELNSWKGRRGSQGRRMWKPSVTYLRHKTFWESSNANSQTSAFLMRQLQNLMAERYSI